MARSASAWKVDERRLYLEIGFRIRLIRDAKEWTQAELAKRVGLSRVYVAQVELAKNRIPIHGLYAFAKAFRLPVAKLLPSIAEAEL